jgi:hypothetical protein
MTVAQVQLGVPGLNHQVSWEKLPDDYPYLQSQERPTIMTSGKKVGSGYAYLLSEQDI